MNPYLLLGLIASSTTILAGLVSLLVSLGVSVLTAFFSIYLFAALIMFGLQRSAIRLDDDEVIDHGDYFLDQSNSVAAVNNAKKSRGEAVFERIA